MHQLQKTTYQLIDLLAVAGFIADRVLKFIAEHLPPGKVFAFVPGFNFGYYLNPALFFFPAWKFIPYLALIVLIALTSWYGVGIATRSGGRHAATYTTLLPILLGGISNVFDRFAYGGVIDYAHILNIATLNLADILILLGLVFLFNIHAITRNS